MMQYLCIGALLFVLLAASVIASVWFVQWLYGGEKRPRI